MELILMRHAKAEQRSTLMPDAERHLTEKGRAKARAVAQGLTCGFLRYSKVFVWSSPFLRAVETAEIAAEILQADNISIYESIATGELDRLAQEWSKLPEKCSLIVVGHQPYLGQWTAQIANVLLPFKPGGSAGFKVAHDGTYEGQLRWVAQPNVLADIAEENS